MTPIIYKCDKTYILLIALINKYKNRFEKKVTEKSLEKIKQDQQRHQSCPISLLFVIFLALFIYIANVAIFIVSGSKAKNNIYAAAAAENLEPCGQSLQQFKRSLKIPDSP